MIYFILLFIEIVMLFLLSMSMSKNLSKFLPMNLMFFVFLPGIIIHEISHLIAAAVLFVPAGQMELAPEKNEEGVRMGSVRIAKTDPLRRFIIGIAPVFVGIVIVIALVYLFSLNISFFQRQNIYIFIATIFALVYLLFAISNTMFSSKADMKGAIELLIAVLAVAGVGYFLGIRIPLSYLDKIINEKAITALQYSALFLMFPVVIDIVILGAVKTAGKLRN